MRVGHCLNRVKRGQVACARVTVCLLVHIPHELDYYAQRFDVLKYALASLWAHTDRDAYDLLVFDNGSCANVAAYLRALRDAGRIDLLIASANRGKIDACRMMFAAAPGDVVAYADDDVWFGPGWLEAQLRILDTFPRVGTVSGRPVRQQFAYGLSYLDRYLAEFPDITCERGRLIPDDWEREYLRSTGRSEAEVEAMALRIEDVRLTCRGVSAYATAAHLQFLAPRRLVLDAIEHPTVPKTGSEERQVEETIAAAGYARLSTTERYIRHIGNVVSAELVAAVGGVSERPYTPPAGAVAGVARLRAARAILGRINRFTFQLLYQPPQGR